MGRALPGEDLVEFFQTLIARGILRISPNLEDEAVRRMFSGVRLLTQKE